MTCTRAYQCDFHAPSVCGVVRRPASAAFGEPATVGGFAGTVMKHTVCRVTQIWKSCQSAAAMWAALPPLG